MARPSEEISKSNVRSAGKPDSNLANDSNHLGGIPADEYLTKNYYDQHMGKYEQDQKKYIDEQDTKNLKAAKDYTDLVIKNQDFSNFAEMKDLQALDDNLSKKIEDCHTNCANELKTKTDAIVKDVNDNFTDVGNSLDNLDKKINSTNTNLSSANSNIGDLTTKVNELEEEQNNLFQSVSDGKRKVAEAITDKGVTTSASDTFDTMAGNIKNIQTGGGGNIPEGYVNTNDATATSSDIMLGQTAYARGSKLTGSYIPPNLYDANATPDKIVSGYTAYVGGGKITGTMDMNGTATPYDIMLGKTAWVNGQKIEGVLDISNSGKPSYNVGDVEKIYGTVTGNLIEQTHLVETSIEENNVNNYILLKDGSENNILGIIKFVATYNGSGYDYKIVTMLHYQTIDGINQFVNSKEYTLDELGITYDSENTSSTDIHFYLKAVNDMANSNKYLAVYSSGKKEGKGTRCLYVFKLEIGEEISKNRSATIEHIIIDTKHKWKCDNLDGILSIDAVAFSEINKERLAIVSENASYYYITTAKLEDFTGDLGLNEFKEIQLEAPLNKLQVSKYNYGSDTLPPDFIRFRANDKIIEWSKRPIGGYFCHKLIILDNYVPINYKDIGSISYKEQYIFNDNFTEAKKISGSMPSTYESFTLNIKHYNLNINYINGDITLTEDPLKEKKLNLPGLIDQTRGEATLKYIIPDNTNTNGIVYINYNVPDVSGNDMRIFNCKIDFAIPEGIVIDTKIMDSYITSDPKSTYVRITGDGKCIYYLNNDYRIHEYISVNDYSKVVALMYQGDYYYKKEMDILNATPSDVLKNRTFIGSIGIPEVGTLELEVE